jgi:hypothetical protein
MIRLHHDIPTEVKIVACPHFHGYPCLFYAYEYEHADSMRSASDATKGAVAATLQNKRHVGRCKLRLPGNDNTR